MAACFCRQPANAPAKSQDESVTARPVAGRRRARRNKPANKKNMLSRLIEGIVHLVEDDDYTTASEGSTSPRAAERQDSGHLTAASSGPNSRRGSGFGGPAAGSPAQQRQQQHAQRGEQQQGQQQRRRRQGSVGGSQDGGGAAGADGEDGGYGGEEEDEEEGGRQRGGGWNILGGVPFLPRIVELLSPKGTVSEEDEGDAEERAAEREREREIERGQRTPTSPGGTSLYPTLAEAEAAPHADDADLQGTTTEPALLAPGQQPLPQLSEASRILSEDQIRALAAAVPARYRHARWALLYSTARDGISLQTLLRNAARRAPTVLVVRDFDRHVFGAYCSEAWKLDKRFFGTGETFVFQLAPRQVAWYWWWRRMAREHNDYFQWGAPEAIAVGGSGGYALWLDSDLTSGISRNSTTFGNDSLAGSEEFKVGAVELWGLS